MLINDAIQLVFYESSADKIEEILHKIEENVDASVDGDVMKLLGFLKKYKDKELTPTPLYSRDKNNFYAQDKEWLDGKLDVVNVVEMFSDKEVDAFIDAVNGKKRPRYSRRATVYESIDGSVARNIICSFSRFLSYKASL